MTRIFTTLAILSHLVLAAAFLLGWNIGDATGRDPLIPYHFLTGLGAVVFAMLVHSIVLTYFMGTGRWLEETSQAYHLSPEWRQKSQSLKYRTIPAMVVCMLLLIVTGAFGAAADPASPVGFQGWFGLSGGTIHMLMGILTWGVHAAVNLYEYSSLERNGVIVNSVLGEVRRIRLERGLEV